MKAEEEEEEERKAGIISPVVYTVRCVILIKCDDARFQDSGRRGRWISLSLKPVRSIW